MTLRGGSLGGRAGFTVGGLRRVGSALCAQPPPREKPKEPQAAKLGGSDGALRGRGRQAAVLGCSLELGWQSRPVGTGDTPAQDSEAKGALARARGGRVPGELRLTSFAPLCHPSFLVSPQPVCCCWMSRSVGAGQKVRDQRSSAQRGTSILR